ncbi:MAG TPA: M90 family metallopeptidase [Usitatibacter sp.]|nr:M90 family metallopeptidase [Usitatibacter sp.]
MFSLVLGVTLLVIAWLLAVPWLQHRRRKWLAQRPFPAEWRSILQRRVPLYARLPAPLRERAERRILIFLAEKQFIGCAGLEVTDEMRVTVAAQAALLVLQRPGNPYPNLRQVLLYPGAFIVERLRPEPSGVLQEHRQVLTGESWSRGQVVLSWEDVATAAAGTEDGANVAIHEFAHQLDQEKGYANGAPYLGHRERYGPWSEVMGREFAQLQWNIAQGYPTLLHPYGATDPAEFFAVASEIFFGQARRLAAEHPGLYAELQRFYRVDPASWPQSPSYDGQ